MFQRITFLIVFFSLYSASAAVNEIEYQVSTYDKLQLDGLMTEPDKISGKLPGVLMIHGAGPMDKNLWFPSFLSGNGKAHGAFSDIAQKLAQKNIISFRYDKRGIKGTGQSPIIDHSIYDNITFKQLVSDAADALKVLQSNPNVDPNKIIILGISQGTLIAPYVATKVKTVSGLVLMASIGKTEKYDNTVVIADLELPTLLLHGESDTVTPLDQALLIKGALEKKGSPFTLITYPGLGHGFAKTDSKIKLGPVETNTIKEIPQWINKNF